LGKRLAEALATGPMRPKWRVSGRPVAAQLHCNVLADNAQRKNDLRSRRHSPKTLVLLVFFQLLRQVVRDSHFADGVQLAFEPVNVVLFVA